MASVQADLYYRKFQRVNPFVWHAVCDLFAEGDHWPSIDELKWAVRENSHEPERPALEGPLPKEDDLIAQLFRYCQSHDVSMYGAALDVIPPWLEAHPEEPDRDRAERFLAQAQDAVAKDPTARDGVRSFNFAIPKMQCATEDHG